MSAAPKQPGLFPPPEPESATRVLTPAEQLAALVADGRHRGMQARHPPQKDRRPYRSKDTIARVKAKMEEMAASGDWSGASGTHLVALYAWLHAQVYGVENAELDGRQWALAAQAAGRMVANHFADDYGSAVVFLRWAWKREQGREQWRRENHKDGGRIGWRLQFSGSIVTDYRVDSARRSR